MSDETFSAEYEALEEQYTYTRQAIVTKIAAGIEQPAAESPRFRG